MNTSVNLNLAEKFLLLALHPEKAKYLVSDQALIAGLTGAILLDLTLEGKLEIKNNLLIATSNKSEISETHNKFLSIIYNFPKKRKIRTWIQRLSNKSQSNRKHLLQDLKSKGFVKITHQRFLFIPYIRARLIRKTERNKLIERLRSILVYSTKPDAEIAPLLGLVGAGKMHRVVAKNKTEIKSFRKKLKELMKSDLIASGVNQVINEMQAAVAAAVLTSTTVATTAGR